MRRARALSWALIAIDLAIVAVTNADALIEDVYEVAPWTDGGCDVWSARFYAVALALSAAAGLLAVVAHRRERAAAGTRTAVAISGLLFLYWFALGFLSAFSMCVYN